MVLSDKENKYSPGKVNFGWPISNFTVNINKKKVAIKPIKR